MLVKEVILLPMFWDYVPWNRHIMQEFEDIEVHKTKFEGLKMIVTNRVSVERLYLDKQGGEEIYIDTCPLPQHQIDGIRFLFRQFKKKKPGVILNNPEGYGKTVQAALFLNAVRGLLKHPVLILCKDDREVNGWIQTLKTWTKYTIEDIAVDSLNVYDKKSIFIKKATDLMLYDRRDWAIMVVKSDVAPKDLMRITFKVAFKVWLTTIDMRKDLKMLNSIYGWMYSEKRFDVQNLLDSETQYRGPLDRLKLLDAFLEDVVIMRNDFPTPYKASHRNTLHILPKITRKNKDATGTKIKRSKKRIEEEQSLIKMSESISENSSFDSDKSIMDDAKKSIDDFRISERIDKGTLKGDFKEMDIEDFIRSKDPVICKEYELITSDLNERSDANSEDISFADAAQDIVDNENETVVDDTEKDSKIVKNETVEGKSEKNREIFHKGNDKTGDNNDDSQSVLTNFSVFDQFKITTKNVESDEKREATSDAKLTVISAKIEKQNGNKETVMVPQINKDITEKDISKDNASVCELDEVKDELTDKPAIDEKKEHKRNIDNKISEMEEQAFKKFKGTLLDSLF